MATKFWCEVREYELDIDANNCGFEWFITKSLTPQEIEKRDCKMASRADSAAKMVEM